ncbi:phage tail protein I, partial [Escherichia coli]|uniref:phage tail protein I n=1 Tax=Escherichia coli TaxID=562 RepID=UPI003EDFF742
TISALRRAVEPLGYLIEVKEWWQLNEEPGTFRIVVGVLDQGIAVIASRTNENLSVHTQADRQPRQMATYWFCIRNKALKFL